MLALSPNLDHATSVRGSPLLRTIFVILGLALAIIPLWKITHRPAAAIIPDETPKSSTQETQEPCPFSLTLSHHAASIKIADAAGTVLWQNNEPLSTTEFSATLANIPETIFLTITWAPQTTTAGRHFAKLRLDPPNRSSLTHIFDSSSDIDDIWELP
jgi:hypothetical protein